jgi:hypothetical protein
VQLSPASPRYRAKLFLQSFTGTEDFHSRADDPKMDRTAGQATAFGT